MFDALLAAMLMSTFLVDVADDGTISANSSPETCGSCPNRFSVRGIMLSYSIEEYV